MSHYVQGQEIGWQNQKGKRGINQQKHNQELATMTMNLRKIKEWEVDKIEQLLLPGVDHCSSEADGHGGKCQRATPSLRRRKAARARKERIATPNSWRRREEQVVGSSPDWAATAWATYFSTIIGSVSQAPVLSATMGIKQTPCTRHASAVWRWTSLCRA